MSKFLDRVSMFLDRVPQFLVRLSYYFLLLVHIRILYTAYCSVGTSVVIKLIHTSYVFSESVVIHNETFHHSEVPLCPIVSLYSFIMKFSVIT